jgi:CubicO group peptidase (beta-lactamase class C family)
VIGPAGSINSNVEDLTNWLRFHLHLGSFHGKRLVSAKNLQVTHSPQMAFSPTYIVPPIFPASFTSDSYGLGWFIGQYRSHVMLYHGGNTIGHSSMVRIFQLHCYFQEHHD